MDAHHEALTSIINGLVDKVASLTSSSLPPPVQPPAQSTSVTQRPFQEPHHRPPRIPPLPTVPRSTPSPRTSQSYNGTHDSPSPTTVPIPPRHVSNRLYPGPMTTVRHKVEVYSTWFTNALEPNLISNLLVRWVVSGGEHCKDTIPMGISIHGLDDGKLMKLAASDVHGIVFQALDALGKSQCLGEDYLATDLSGESWESRPLVKDFSNGSYSISLQVHPDFNGVYNLTFILFYTHIFSLTVILFTLAQNGFNEKAIAIFPRIVTLYIEVDANMVSVYEEMKLDKDTAIKVPWFTLNDYTLYITTKWHDLHPIIIVQLYCDMLAPGATKSAHAVWFFIYNAITYMNQLDKDGDLRAVPLFFSKGYAVNVPNRRKYTPLLNATTGENAKICAFLIARCAHFNQWDPGGVISFNGKVNLNGRSFG